MASPMSNRSVEYDTPDGTYGRFLLEEILPEVAKKYTLTDKPEERAICGSSSGGICAFKVAWERPDAFQKVVSHIGSFTNIRGGYVYPSLIRKTEAKASEGAYTTPEQKNAARSPPQDPCLPAGRQERPRQPVRQLAAGKSGDGCRPQVRRVGLSVRLRRRHAQRQPWCVDLSRDHALAVAGHPMSASFAELDYRQTPLGELTLRRRRIASLDGMEIFEVKLGDAFLMSSLFHEVEVALADLGFVGLDAPLDVVVGGLGLGYTARAALNHPAVRSVIVVEALDAVIEWHERGLVPLGPELTGDPHCRFVHGDFFALAAASGRGFDPAEPGRKFHAVLLDIDHSPRNLLDARHGAFYEPAGLRELAVHLHPGGVFAFWSDDPPDERFLMTLRDAFNTADAHVVSFHNPLLERDSASTVYVARIRSKPQDLPPNDESGGDM